MTDSFGELLRRFRVEASLTQEALADRCRISPATVAAIEQGRRTAPRLSTVRLIADALELPAEDLAKLAAAAQGGTVRTSADRPGGRGAAGVAPFAAAVAAGQVKGVPTTWTSFIGRESEQAAILAALADSRVVSLVGPGGVGKTRLAIAAVGMLAGQYPAGALYVDLVPVREGFVSQAVATLLGLAEGPGRSLDTALHEQLSRGRWLLVLDNCEHLLDVAADFVEKLLANCDDLTVLVTSRERLAIAGERIITVPPLSLNGNGDAAAGSEAEALFIDRARASDPAFTAPLSAVREVCRRLDGVPLAIEIAAARSASLGLDGLLAGLDDHLRLLAGSHRAQKRHRSLRAVIDWSYDLLDADERVMFRRAGVFTGGFDLDAAVAVCAVGGRGVVADLLGRLADKSLLTHRQGPAGSRWQMLATIRAYALDKLADSDDEARLAEGHLRWAASAAAALERMAEAGQQWRAGFDAVADDLRAAVARPCTAHERELSHGLARTLGHLAYARRFMLESREHYLAAAARAAGGAEAAADLRAAADVAMAEGHGALAFDLLTQAAARATAAGDAGAAATALAYAVTIADRFAAQFSAEVPNERLRELYDQAIAACPAGDETAQAYLAAAAAWIGQPEKTVPDAALSGPALAAARRTGDPVLISGALDTVVAGLDAGGRLRDAHQVNKERAALLEYLPRHDPRAGTEIIDTMHMVTEIAVTAGDLPDALASASLAQDDDIAGGQPHMTASKPILPLVLQGRFGEALRQAELMWDSWLQAGRPAARWMGPAMYGIVLAHGLRGDEAARLDWLARIDELVGSRRDQISETNLAVIEAFTTARIALHAGRIDEAVTATAGLAMAADVWYDAPQWYSLRAYTWAVAAEVAVAGGQPAAADLLAAAAPAGDENYWAAACLTRAFGRLHGDRGALERSVAGWDRIGARFERACTLLLLDDRAGEGAAELQALGCRAPAGPHQLAL